MSEEKSVKIRRELNTFFVDCFYAILRSEERSLESISNGKLSLKEIHVIEAVNKAVAINENTISGVAKILCVTVGTLTVAVNVLEKKGYVVKTRDQHDKRITYLTLTELGEYINESHEKFHKQMIDDVMHLTNEREQEILISSLKKLKNYFNK